MKGFIMENIMKQVEKTSQELALAKQLKALYAEFEARLELNMYSEELAIYLMENISIALKMIDIDLEAANVIAMSVARNMYM